MPHSSYQQAAALSERSVKACLLQHARQEAHDQQMSAIADVPILINFNKESAAPLGAVEHMPCKAAAPATAACICKCID